MLIDIVLVFAQGRGGLEDVLTKVSNELVKRGHRVRIFQTYKPTYGEWINTLPEIHFYGMYNNLSDETMYTSALGYKTCLDNMEKPDIIIATHAPSLSFICKAAIGHLEDKKPKIISWIHSMPEYFGGEELLNNSDAHLAISSYIGEKIKKYVGDLAPIYMIGNPVDDSNFKVINQEKEKLRLLYVGRISKHEKRLDVLFKALSLLDKDWDLRIIGSGSDEIELMQLAEKLNIDENIQWMGWRDNPWDSIDNITALVLSSDFEGFPMVVPEALGRGIAVIATDCSGITDLIENGKNGWIFERGNYKQLYEILKLVKDKKVELPNQQDCINSIQEFKIDKVVDKIESAIINTYNSPTYKQELEKIVLDISNLVSIKNFELAKSLIYKYKKLFKYDISLYCIEGAILLEEKDYAKAYEVFKEGLTIDDFNISLLYNLGYTSCLLGDAYKGIDYYIKSLSYSNDLDFNAKLENILSPIVDKEIKDYLEKGEIDKAISIYKKWSLNTKNNNLKKVLLENIYSLHQYRKLQNINKKNKDLNKNENLLSIVISSYKKLEYLKDSIDSVLSQTYQNIELIIADDCSENFDAKEYEQYIQDKKGENIKNIIVYKNTVNLGTVSNANKALSLANGSYIKFIGNDDKFYYDKASEDMINYLNDKESYVLMSNMLYCDLNMQELDIASSYIDLYRKVLPYGTNPNAFANIMCQQNLIPSPGVLFKSEVFDIYGMLDEEYMYIEDYPYWLKLFENEEKMEYLDIISVRYRYGDGVSTNRKLNKEFSKDVERSNNLAKLIKEKMNNK